MKWEVKLIEQNRPRTPLRPVGVVVHSTANPGASADDHYRYWSSGIRHSSVHIVVDWDGAIDLIPWRPGEAEVAWHAGPTANKRFIGIEICEHKDYRKQMDSILNAAKVVQTILSTYNWKQKNVIAHGHVSLLTDETDHSDPFPAFDRVNLSWSRFLGLIRPVAVEVHGTTVQGWLDGGLTVAPVRPVAEALGATVIWTEEKVIVRK